jgi:hypothetical protein
MIDRIIYFTALFASVVVSACTKSELATPFAESERVIGVAVGEIKSRATVIETASEILSLGIFGYSTDTEDFDPTNPDHTPNLFFNTPATRADALSPWVYDPVAVWPSEDTQKSTFFAYSPYRENGAVGSTGYFEVPSLSSGAPLIKYRTPRMVSEQVDLLYSEYVTAEGGLNPNVANINATTNSGGVVLYNMKHALLWLNFVIATEDMDPSNPDETYFITEFTMLGGNIMAAASLDLGTGVWSPDPEFSGDADGYENILYEFDYLKGTGNAQPITAGQIVSIGGGGTDCLMIIPDSFKTSDNLTSVGLSYTHDTDSVFDPADTKYHVQLPFPDVKLDTPGMVMTFVVKISTNGASIEFQNSSVIEKWIENSDYRQIAVF